MIREITLKPEDMIYRHSSATARIIAETVTEELEADELEARFRRACREADELDALERAMEDRAMKVAQLEAQERSNARRREELDREAFKALGLWVLLPLALAMLLAPLIFPAI